MYASCCSLTSIAPLLTKEDMSAAAADTVWIHILELKAPFLSIRCLPLDRGGPGGIKMTLTWIIRLLLTTTTPP